MENDEGCPHMICAMCEGEFWWTCLKDWVSHDQSHELYEKVKKKES